MKNKDEINPNYAPIYAAALYPDLARIFIDNGYALAVHGSLKRDFDLIAVPWTDNPSEPSLIIKQITTKFNIRQIDEPENKKHGRIAYTISVGHGCCALDLSFMPIIKNLEIM